MRVEASASCTWHGTPAAVRRWGDLVADVFAGRSTALAERAVALGWADPAELSALAAAYRAWGEDPAAFQASPWGEAVGWAPDGGAPPEAPPPHAS